MGMLLRQAVSQELLLQKADYLKERNFKPGFDNMTSDGAKLWLQINGEHLRSELLGGAYQPQPASGFYQGKRNGSYRLLTKLTAMDSLIQYAILDILQPLCEKQYDDSSFGYRPNRGVTGALNRYCLLGSTHKLAAKIDPVRCFDSIDRSVLAKQLSATVPDEELCALIMRFAEMPVVEDGKLVERPLGILQGAPLSPLLCNLYFHPMDCFLREKGIDFIRYADDLVLFADSADAISAALRLAEQFETEQLHLRVNAEKSAISAPSGLRYLGYRFHTDKRGMIALEAAASERDAYHAWHEQAIRNNRRRVNILSDGILRQRDFSLLFETDSGKQDIPPATTDIINVYSSVVLDSGFLARASAFGITVNLFDKYGHLIGRYLPAAPLRAPTVIHAQLMLYYNEAMRAELAGKIVLASVHHSVLNLRNYNKTAPDPVYPKALDALAALERKIRVCKSTESLLMLEAQARDLYYGCYDTMLRQSCFRYEKRSRRPPRNAFNAMLSFGNTVLYSVVAEAINKTSLDIRAGILHATNSRLESLNLDLAEIFKPLIVDRVVLTLINRRAIREEHFRTEENGGVYLTAEGKRIFLRAFYDKLDTTVTIKDEKRSYERIITEEPRKLVRYFRAGEPYKPYRQLR